MQVCPNPRCSSERTVTILANGKIYCRKCHFLGTEGGMKSNAMLPKKPRIITSEMRRRAAAAPHGHTPSEKAAIEKFLQTRQVRRSETPMPAKNSILLKYE